MVQNQAILYLIGNIKCILMINDKNYSNSDDVVILSSSDLRGEYYA